MRRLRTGACRRRPARSAGRDSTLPSSCGSTRRAWRATSASWVTMMIVWPGRVQLVEQREDLVAGAAVEVAGRLVGEQDRRAVDQRPGDGDALLLAAGELVGPVASCGRPGRRSSSASLRALAAAPPAVAACRAAAARRSSARSAAAAARSDWKTNPIRSFRTRARAAAPIRVTSPAVELVRAARSGGRGSRGCSSACSCPSRWCP